MINFPLVVQSALLKKLPESVRGYTAIHSMQAQEQYFFLLYNRFFLHSTSTQVQVAPGRFELPKTNYLLKSSSRSIPKSFNILSVSPFFKGVWPWTGITSSRSPRERITWLPRCLSITKPRSKASFINSGPLSTGSLGNFPQLGIGRISTRGSGWDFLAFSTCRYKSRASLMFSRASSRVSPWEWQPGSSGTYATKPPSPCSSSTT